MILSVKVIDINTTEIIWKVVCFLVVWLTKEIVKVDLDIVFLIILVIFPVEQLIVLILLTNLPKLFRNRYYLYYFKTSTWPS